MKKFIVCVCILVMMLSVCAFALDVNNVNLTINPPTEMGGDISVTGSFTAGSEFAGKGYYVFLARLNSSRKFESAEVSQKFVATEGANSFTAHFPVKAERQNVRAFLLSEDFSPLRKNVQKSVSAVFLDWDVDGQELYDFILSDSVSKNTDFSKFLSDDDELTVAEGLAMTSYLHADYNNADVNAAINGEFKLDFDGDETQICTLSYHNATGSVADGVITYQPSGSFDHGLKIEGIELDAKKYNRMTVRMKRDFLANSSTDSTSRIEELEIFYKTNLDPKYTGSKVVYYRIPKEINMADWFEVTIELNDSEYTDLITGIRFDSTNNNGVYYVDYITLSQSTSNSTQTWYDKYVDYLTAKGLINVHTFGIDSYDRAITREELYALFTSATAEANFGAINSIKGIPDVKKDDWNADVFLMLYNAGITLGDANGNFNAKGTVKRSEAAMTYNRMLTYSNRLTGSVSSDWTSSASGYDLEFTESYSWFLNPQPYKFTNVTNSISNGVLTMTAKTNSSGNYDPYIYFDKNKNVSAENYDKAIVRMKVEGIDTDIEDVLSGFFFKTSENNSWSETLSLHNKLGTYCYKDAAGWYIVEFDLRLQAYWKGNITAIRFDPANQKGTFKLDYIRLIPKDDSFEEHDDLISAGYEATQLLSDMDFENGFYVCQFEQKNYYEHGLFTYNNTESAPLWQIDPWWSQHDLWENRDTTADKYTLKDTYGINTLVYNPDLKSLSMRLDATKIYNGQPHDENYAYWPHLLVEQNTNICPIDKQKHTLSEDNKLFAEIDLRMTDFKNTTNTAGENSCLYLVYFYLKTDKAPGHKIWFGLTLFEEDANKTSGADWNYDPYSGMMIYRMTTVSTYGDLSESFTPSVGTFSPGNDWKTLRVDLMPEIRRAVEWANRDNIFGTQVSVEDMYIDGVNLGYEIHGNFDCTFEIKNFGLVSYEK